MAGVTPLAQEGEVAKGGPWSASEPCVNYTHPYEADLCQQWRQAEAAEKAMAAAERTAEAAERAARLSRLQTLFATAATGLLLLLFFPLLIAALAARRAAKALTQTRQHEESELRAYVDVEKLEFVETPEAEGVIKVKVVFKNSGQTPAFDQRSATEVGVHEPAREEAVPFMPLPEGPANSGTPRLGRGATSASVVKCHAARNIADRVTNGETVILVWGWTEYVDIFDRQRKTVFQYLCDAETLESGLIFKPMHRSGDVT
jgi:hypothetical protein